MTVAAAIDDLVVFYETLAPATLPRLAVLYAADARFKDPFNEVTGVVAIQRIFQHMFATLEAPRFRVNTRIVQGPQAMLGWDFELRLKGQPMVIRGVSHLVFDATGRVIVHRDYWDAAEELYEKFPLVGRLMGFLKRRLAAPEKT